MKNLRKGLTKVISLSKRRSYHLDLYDDSTDSMVIAEDHSLVQCLFKLTRRTTINEAHFFFSPFNVYKKAQNLQEF